MIDAELEAFATEAGVLVEWDDVHGKPCRTPPQTLRSVLAALGLPASTPAELKESRARLAATPSPDFITAQVGQPFRPVGGPCGAQARLRLEDGEVLDIALDPQTGFTRQGVDVPGYHRLEVAGREITVAVAPPRAFGLDDLAPHQRLWGLAVQLYALRGRDPRPFGDFGDLAGFADAAGRRGAAALAISPVHALFAADAERFSPYAPSSRLFLNGLYADPAAVLGDQLGDLGHQPAGGDLVAWSSAIPARWAALRRVHARFKAEASADLRADLQSFTTQGGEDLRGHARFEAIHGAFFARDGARGWPEWPADLHDAASPAVAAFAAEHGDEIDFHIFVQWLADRSLARAQHAARAAGMPVGLITDVAVGMDPGGSHAWSRPQDLLAGLNIGAPPDAFQANGQDWGVTTFSPRALAASGYAGFLATLRSAMRHAGGVRIDHILGLRRLWVVPHGAGPTEGAYLTYPMQDLMRLIAIESHRHGVLVVGEDLGTVPPGLRETLAAGGVRGMQVLLFEQDETGAFKAPEQWSPRACAMTTTHDLPPIAGWWRGTDIDWRVRLQPDLTVDEVTALRSERETQRTALWAAFCKAGCAEGDRPSAEKTGVVVDAAIDFLARTSAELAILPIEDLLGLEAQPNLPGTTTEHPNWRRRLAGPAGALFDAPGPAGRIASLNKERPR
ncbi:4-alpha-glucanotransferase [Phenylobacterium sp.]|uniref:4-alpha-glucanotransferase n=1 Tax=Phenylobacterium sp. TaxID=1871053 RepID=UPI00272FB639|nr:4-alpha-glucanotransferase [Phenylobacterium sp.]MDP1619275.1 4-alpha-glucanotransferase [Phenylobacterium sp.]MDP1986377.1 4-alpha-glucanotransferase [Phenylobacterium sp.]